MFEEIFDLSKTSTGFSTGWIIVNYTCQILTIPLYYYSIVFLLRQLIFQLLRSPSFSFSCIAFPYCVLWSLLSEYVICFSLASTLCLQGKYWLGSILQPQV